MSERYRVSRNPRSPGSISCDRYEDPFDRFDQPQEELDESAFPQPFDPEQYAQTQEYAEARVEFESLLAESDRPDRLRRGDVSTGTVVDKVQGGYLIEVDQFPKGPMLLPADRASRRRIEPGQSVAVFVTNPDGVNPADEEDSLPLVATGGIAQEALEKLHYEEVKDTMHPGDKMTGIVEYIFEQGHLIVRLPNGAKGFVPHGARMLLERASGEHPSWGRQYTRSDYAGMIGQEYTFWLRGHDDSKYNFILTCQEMRRRPTYEEKQRFADAFEEVRRNPDEKARRLIVTATVDGIKPYGAFCRFEYNGVFYTGLLHISQLSHRRVEHPGEVVRKGREIKVEVANVDRLTGRIALSLKSLEVYQDPWEDIESQIIPGIVVTGTIVNIVQFGAFCEIQTPDGTVQGLIHISELSDQHVDHPREVVRPGQQVDVEVITVDPRRHRLGLSIKRVRPEDRIQPELSEEGDPNDYWRRPSTSKTY